MPATRQFEIPADLADKLEKMAKHQGKSAQTLLVDIVSEHIELTEFILRKANERSGKGRR